MKRKEVFLCMQIAYEAPQFSAGFLVYKAETDPLSQMRPSRQKT